MMKYLLTACLVVLLGLTMLPEVMAGAQQRVVIRIGGKYCMFHSLELAQALKRVSGVMSVDFETMRGNVIVLVRAGKVNPDHLLSAFQSIKGDGYFCKGEFNGDPGKVEY
jgi:hypothetical protein